MSIDFTDPNRAEEILREAKHALEESKAQYELMVSMISDIVWHYEVNTIGEHVGSYISPVADKMLGLPDGTIGNSFDKYFSYVHPDDLPTFQVILSEGIRTREKDITAEYRLRKGDGTTLWVRSKGSAYCKDGRITVFGTTSDITERISGEDELLSLKTQIEFILGATKTGLDIIDAEFNIRYIDSEWQKVYGDPTGRKCYDYFMGSDQPCPGCGIVKALHTKSPTVTEEVLVKENSLPIQVTTIPFQNKAGEWLVAEVNVDITERKKAEDELIDGRNKLKALFELLPAGISILDQNRKVIYVNPALERTLDLTAEELREGKFRKRKYLRPDGSECPPEEFPSSRAVAEEGIAQNAEVGVIKEDGTKIWTDVRAISLPFPDWRVVIIVSDITGRKQAEEKLTQYSERLEEIIEARTKQLQQADRLAAIGETATMISHDLRNPLQVIVSMVYLAKEMLTSADTSSLEGRRSIVEILDDIEKSCSYMSRILSDLQCYGGPLNLKFAETDIHMLISDALSVLLIPKYVEVSIEVENGLSEITIDPEKIKRVIVNLVNNSIQSMPKGGQITITAIRKGESIVLTVRDEGMGIPNEDIPKLFLPIVTTKAKGTGLGLAICKRLVEAHGGNIVVTSKVNVGTKITIEIPQDRKTWTRS